MLLWVAALLCGCTTMRPVAPLDLTAALSGLEAGDEVAVRVAGAWHEDLTVTGVTDAGFQAESGKGERFTFARADVQELRTRVHAPGRTVGLVLGILWFYPGIPGLSLCTAHGGC